jgi:hypothetical protein
MVRSYIRNQDENGMNEYDRVTDEWNRSGEVQRHRTERANEINNTPYYYTGNRIHHLRTIQMHSFELWNQLFRYDELNPVLRQYVQASIGFAEDDTQRLLFAGQMEVSLILQENYRPGIHVAIFIIQLSPHRQFYDGHVIQREFGDGSYTHQTINQMFNTDDHAIVSQATEYDILEYIANDDDMRYLLHRCFMDPDFTTVQYIHIMPPPGFPDNEDGVYVVDHDRRGDLDQHRVHNFEPFVIEPNIAVPDVYDVAVAAAADADADAAAEADAAADADAEVNIAIPPPPPVNNFEELYHYNYNNYYDNYDNYNNYNNNIIPYYDDDNSDSDDDDRNDRNDDDDSDSDDEDSDDDHDYEEEYGVTG